jgi:hypothetical protein
VLPSSEESWVLVPGSEESCVLCQVVKGAGS